MSKTASHRITYGGTENKGRRKIQRPFDASAPLLLTWQAKTASGGYSLLHRKNKSKIEKRIYALAYRYQVRIRLYKNIGNQIRLVIHAKNRYSLTCFLRTATGQCAQLITGARKGVKKGKYWGRLCWSRVLRNIQEFKEVKSIFDRNILKHWLIQPLGSSADSIIARSLASHHPTQLKGS